jgi:hypothetical protein
MDQLATVGTILLVGALLAYATWRLKKGNQLQLRPLSAFSTLEGNVGKATESASRFHISVGQASLNGAANPTSIAAMNVLDRLARDGCANNTPPIVSVGEGTLLLVAQERLQDAYRQAELGQDEAPAVAEFVAHETDPYAYAGGVASLIQQNRLASNVLVGHFGPELAIMAEAATRKNVDQIVGTDDPTTLALGAAMTDNLLVGEELFAAGAYLNGTLSQLAAVQTQDILRLLITLGILGVAVYRIVVGG